MKYVKIFLASSITEFETERKELGDYIRMLNDIYVKRGMYFELTICEDLSNSMAMARKQAEYNQKIRESQFFYVLFGKNAGEYTIEEFDVALESFHANGAPQIYTYFLKLPEGKKPEVSVSDFVKRLDQELGHYYSVFSHLDSVKLNMLLELTRDDTLQSDLKFEGGQALLADKPILDLENIPLYSKNEALHKLAEKKKQLDEAFSELAIAYGKQPRGELLNSLMELGTQRTKIAEQLHQLEMEVLNLCRQTGEKRRLGQKINWRERKALELVDQGAYEGAKAILRDALWEEEVRHAEETVQAAKDSITEYISGKRTLIATLKSSGLEPDTISEIISLYKSMATLAVKHNVELTVLYDYALFLYDQCEFKESVAVAERYRQLLDVSGRPEQRVILYNLLGNLYHCNHDYFEAERYHQKSLEGSRRLAIEKPGLYEWNVAMSCNNLANLLLKTTRRAEAEDYYIEALALYRRLERANAGKYTSDVALATNNLAGFYVDAKHYDLAEPLYQEAETIYERLCAMDPGTYESVVASVYKNKAIFLKDTNRTKEAELYYHKALEVKQRLACKNPGAYEPGLGAVYVEIADFLVKTKRFGEAEQYYSQALEIAQRLLEHNPSAYASGFAAICEKLADLRVKTLHIKEAEVLYRKAIDLYKKLVAKAPDDYEQLERCCGRLKDLYVKTGRWEDAEYLCRDLLTISKELSVQNPEGYEGHVFMNLSNLAVVLAKTSHAEEEAIWWEALDICRKMGAKNRSKYEGFMVFTLNALGNLLWKSNRLKEAESIFQEALKLLRKKTEEVPEQWGGMTASTCTILALVLRSLSRQEEAVQLCKEALERYQALVSQAPGAYEKDMVNTCELLAYLLREMSRAKEADMVHKEAERMKGRIRFHQR